MALVLFSMVPMLLIAGICYNVFLGGGTLGAERSESGQVKYLDKFIMYTDSILVKCLPYNQLSFSHISTSHPHPRPQLGLWAACNFHMPWDTRERKYKKTYNSFKYAMS